VAGGLAARSALPKPSPWAVCYPQLWERRKNWAFPRWDNDRTTAVQVPAQARDPVTGQFLIGWSGNPAGKMSKAARQARLEGKCRELASEFAGWDRLSVVERTLIEQAAALLLRKPPRSEDAVRCANSVQPCLPL
jgi:hypothetical protein